VSLSNAKKSGSFNNNNNSNFLRTDITDIINKEFSTKFDLEGEFNANNWADLQTTDYLQTLTKQARNKQENIFEFYKTELNYVKILNITQRIYVNVMLNDCKIDRKELNQIFPDLDKLYHLHRNLLNKLIERYETSEHRYINSIGDILLDILNGQCDTMVDIYSNICCMHLTAKSVYKKLSLTNKPFIHFLQECQKHTMLRRYPIPDCLTIITQRLTKYLTLIDNMVNNSKECKKDYDLLTQALDKIRFLLTRVNDAVALYQNSNAFNKILDTFDSKSSTHYSIKHDNKKIEHVKLTKNDLIASKRQKRIYSINQVNVRCLSKKEKIYKEVTCLTMNDMILFLQMNDKKYTFMNNNSVIPLTNGILIRPKDDAIPNSKSFNSTSTITPTASYNTMSNSLSSTSMFPTSNNTSSNTTLTNSSTLTSTTITTTNNTINGSSSTLIAYIVNLITTEILEITFNDECSRNQWLLMAHSQITPFIEGKQLFL
jgi:hypothetical protein